MAIFCDFENLAIGVRDAKYDKFDMGKVLEHLLIKGGIVVNSAGNYGTPKTLTVTVSQPPDYVLRGDYDSSFAVSGNVTAVAFSNAKLHADVGGVVMPINTTETVEQHFSRSLIGHNNRLDGWTLSNSTVTFDSTTDPNG